MAEGRRAIYPGSFNPPTIAHLELSRAVRNQRDCSVVVWSLTKLPLGKEGVRRPTIAERATVLQRVAARVDWLEVQVTEQQLLADIAQGFEVVVMGADKWHQINEIQWYGSEAERDAAIAALPEIAVGPRPPYETPADLALALTGVAHVSSSAARQGAVDLMLPEARASGLWRL